MISNEAWKQAEYRLSKWRMRAQRNQALHYAAARSQLRLHYAIGIPTVISSAFVATLGFIAVGSSLSQAIAIGVAMLGSAATILAALQTFLNFGSRAEAHQKAGIRFGNVSRDIEALLAIPQEQRSSIQEVVSRFSERMNTAASEAPPIPDKLMKKLTVEFAGVGTNPPNSDPLILYPWDLDNPRSPFAGEMLAFPDSDAWSSPTLGDTKDV